MADYYINGTKQMVGSYSDRKGKTKDGLFIYYNEKGLKTSEGFYMNNVLNGSWSFWNDSGYLDAEGMYVDDKRDGEWIMYNARGELSQKWAYEEGKILTMKQFHADGRPFGDKDTFSFAEKMPEFPGGQKALFGFISDYVIYPKAAKEKNIRGRVVLQFIVDTEGSVQEVTVVKSVHPLLDEEAVRVVSAMPQWRPGMQDGKPVTVRFTLPIIFKLN